MAPPQIVTLGHAIVDVLAPSPDELVARLALRKGTMALVDDRQAEEIYDSLGPATEVSGGSAANTAAALASLGTDVQFVGKIRDDALGHVFSHDIRAAGVRFVVEPTAEGPGTGRCLIMVTPDAEKTMCTNLGIGALLSPSDLPEEAIGACEVLYIEGYLYGLRETDLAVERAIEVAREGGAKVALSLSDPAWVEAYASHFERILDRVDLLFANEDEARGMAGTETTREAVEVLAKRCAMVAVTLGAKGSMVASNGDVVTVAAAPAARVVDTTGAGDSFAAGLLFGVVNGYPPERCAEIGGVVAGEVVSHLGARPQQPLRDLAASAGLLGG